MTSALILFSGQDDIDSQCIKRTVTCAINLFIFICETWVGRHYHTPRCRVLPSGRLVSLSLSN